MKRYTEYKDSGVEWIEKIPKEWTIKKLAFLGTFSKGGGLSKADLTESGEAVILYGDIYTKYDWQTKVLLRHTSKEVASLSKEIFYGDILFTGSGETAEDIGKCIVYLGKDPAYAGGDVLIFRPVSMDSLFLSYVLNCHELRAEKAKLAKGQIIIHIYSSQLRNLSVPFPALQEQTQIAQYLDHKTAQIDKLISDKEKLIELLNEERTVIINQAVTKGLNPEVPMKDSGIEWLGEVPEHWEVKRLKFIGIAFGGLTYAPENIVGETDGTLVLRSSNIQNGKLSLEDNVYVNSKISDKLTLKKGDILICSRNGSQHLIGKNICIGEDMAGNTFGAFMMIFRSKNWKFLKHYFNSAIFTSQSGLFLTATINQLTTNTLNNFWIAIPESTIEQEEISKYVDEKKEEIETIVKKTNQEIQLLKEYKTALISEVVTGKVDVRDKLLKPEALA